MDIHWHYSFSATIILNEVGLKPITYAKAGKLEEKMRTKGKIGYRILTKSKNEVITWTSYMSK